MPKKDPKESTTEQESAKARLQILPEDIVLSYTNSAPDFINVTEDELSIQLQVLNMEGDKLFEFEDLIQLKFKAAENDDEYSVMVNNPKKHLEIDLSLDEIMQAWMGVIRLVVINKLDNYITYRTKSANYKLDWLQWSEADSDFKSLSKLTKHYDPSFEIFEDSFSIRDIEICSEMLSKAIKKVDVLIGSALVKFNTDEGRLEPVIATMADKLGFKIEKLDQEEIVQLEMKQQSVSHSISFKD